ncbi:MAG: aspartate-semialdehyde dehydrogenase [Actinomycetota bacterium]|nr:aspartate-semialdehyde dehydrogenase [Actinomycetota bacterium]
MSEPDAKRQPTARVVKAPTSGAEPGESRNHPASHVSADERPPRPLKIAVVGATGAVGEEMRRLLQERAFPIDGRPVLVASERSAGRRLNFARDEVEVTRLAPEVFDDVDLALFSAGRDVSRLWAPVAAERGAVVIDNSSAWRREPDVPLVVSEVNPHELPHRPRGIIANPNCTTMVLMVAVKPLHDVFGLEAMVTTSYQSAGGAGQKGMSELLEQTAKLLDDPDMLRRDGRAVATTVSPTQFSKVIAFNVLPHCGRFTDDRYTDEEWKLVHESRKILELPDLQVSPTCVRVPVLVGHAIAARLSFRRAVEVDAALDVLRTAPGLLVEDGTGQEDGQPLAYPTPLESAGRDEVFVGRVRRDLADPKTVNLFVVGDNLLKGAALNAVQLAELVAIELG